MTYYKKVYDINDIVQGCTVHIKKKWNLTTLVSLLLTVKIRGVLNFMIVQGQ